QIRVEKAKLEQSRLDTQAKAEQKEKADKAQSLSVAKEVMAFKAEIRSILNAGTSGEQAPYILEKAKRLEKKTSALCIEYG
ncbi:hypothetical protein ACI3PL_29860, partial [Lacticaseibacillus paracasei]